MKLHFHSLQLDLPDFPLEIDAVLKGPVTGIWGPSGIGKTTILEAIAGLRQPTTGRLIAGDQVWSDGSRAFSIPPPRRPIGYAPQDMALFPHINVRKNLLFGQPSRRRLLPGWARRNVGGDSQPRWSEIVDLLEIGELLDRPILGLSGGERQRVVLGRALLAPARLWLLDEPISSLDQPLRRRILSRLRELVESLHRTVIYVSHDRTEITHWCDEILAISPERRVELSPARSFSSVF